MAMHATETQEIEAQIAEAAVATEALAKQIFGDAAYLVRDVDVDRETGDEETVFEVHCCFEDPEHDFDRLVEVYDTFVSAFVRATAPEVLSRVVLDVVPCDSDHRTGDEAISNQLQRGRDDGPGY